MKYHPPIPERQTDTLSRWTYQEAVRDRTVGERGEVQTRTMVRIFGWTRGILQTDAAIGVHRTQANNASSPPIWFPLSQIKEIRKGKPLRNGSSLREVALVLPLDFAQRRGLINQAEI